MKIRRYEQYKDSGVAWLGSIPQGWSVAPFKREIERNDGGVWGEEPEALSGTLTTVLRSTEQTVDGQWKIDEPAMRKLSDSDLEAALLAEGDLVVTKSSGSSLHIGKTTIVTAEIAARSCAYSNFMQRIRVRSSFVPRFGWYVLNNDISRTQFDLRSNSTTGLANLNGSMIGELSVPIPPVSEQHSIVAFLDHETAKIDTLISKQEKLIELLKEKRQAVISHAVTKGLDPTVPMKPSGVEWLGDVPEGFQVMRLKHASPEITVGIVVEPSKYYVEDGVPCFRSLNVRKMRLVAENLVYISAESNEQLKKSMLRSGDLVAVRTGQPGTTAVVAEEFDGTNCIDLIIIRRSDKYLSKYLGYFLNSDAAIMQYAAGSGGAIQQHFNVETAGNLIISLPSLPVQEQIVKYLDKATSQFDCLIGKAERAISLQREHRTALISAAVTGKIDVREAVSNLQEAA